jgi:hypothetical protein
MPKLIPLLILLLYAQCYSSGHHRGEEDIELSPSIMRFLIKIKEDTTTECDDDLLNDAPDYPIPLRRLSISINKYIESSNAPKVPPNTPEEESKIEHSSKQ